MARVLILPARDFDPDEAAVSSQVLSNAGHTISFAAPGWPGDVHSFAKTFAGLLK
jgi:hypothetical protein